MIWNILYGLNPLVAVSMILLVAIAVSLVGQLLTERVFPLEVRCAHNELLGPAAGIAGVINAVLLAFIVFAAWTDYDRARDVVSQEVGLVTDIWRDAEAAASVREPGVHDSIVHGMLNYLSTVVDSEWPYMKSLASADSQSHHFVRGWQTLRVAYEAALHRDSGISMQKTLAEEVVKRFNSLFDARRQRIAYSTHHALTATAWGVVLAGGLVSIACCWLFGFKSRKLHAASTALVAASFGLVFFLIIALQWPFRGETQISVEPYCTAAKFMFQMERREPGGGGKQALLMPAKCPCNSRP